MQRLLWKDFWKLQNKNILLSRYNVGADIIRPKNKTAEDDDYIILENPLHKG